MTTHSKDALKCPVGNSTGCPPPPSRAVTASLSDLRTASAANRRECDSNGIADGAVSDQVVVGQAGTGIPPLNLMCSIRHKSIQLQTQHCFGNHPRCSPILRRPVSRWTTLRTTQESNFSLLPKLAFSATKRPCAKFYERPIPCLLYTSPSPRDATLSRMPSSA